MITRSATQRTATTLNPARILSFLLDFFDLSAEPTTLMRPSPLRTHALGGGYVDPSGIKRSFDTVGDITSALESGKVTQLGISGETQGLNITLVIWPASKRATFEISGQNEERILAKIRTFNSEFEAEPFSNLDKYLIQRGYKFKTAPRSEMLPNYDYFHKHTHRIAKKQEDLPSYPRFFEKYIESIAAYDFELDTRLNVELLEESTGGDYDVLALNSANDLVYFEAKTGNIDTSDLKHFYSRHRFLKPAASILVLDQSKATLLTKLPMMFDVITDANRKVDPTAPRFDVSETIPDPVKEYAFHVPRNLYFVSAENISRGIAHCLRHLDGTVKQSSYLG